MPQALVVAIQLVSIHVNDESTKGMIAKFADGAKMGNKV